MPSLGYKNFSMFDQSTLAEKMEGVRMIASLARSKADTGIFDSYAREFGSNRAAEADFARNLNKTKQLYEGRRDDIPRIFQERLAVDTFQFGVSGGGEHVARRDACLNLLDCLEKLTSPTVMTTRGGIGLAYPQIADPDQRREWRVRQDAQSGELVFSCAGTPRQIAAALRGLEAFPGYQGVAGQGPSRGRWRRVDIPHAARRAAGHRQGVQLRGCRPAQALTGARPRRRAAKEYLPMTASHPAKLRAIAKALGVDASIFDEEGSAALQLDNVPFLLQYYSDGRDQVLVLAADLGVVAPEDGVRVHPLLLAANSSWRALAGGVLTLDEARSMAMLVLRLEVAALDDEALSQRLYASPARRWTGRHG